MDAAPVPLAAGGVESTCNLDGTDQGGAPPRTDKLSVGRLVNFVLTATISS